MKVATFRNIATRLASTIGRRKGVKVVFKGHEAMTDGKTILIPALPPGTWLSQVQAKVFMGYLDHEIGHVLLTDTHTYTEEAKKRDSALFSYVLNVIEDVREERAYIEQYPGAKEDLDTLCQYLEGQVVEKVEGMPKDLLAKHMLALFYEECWLYRDRPRLMPGKLTDYPVGGKELTTLLKVIPTLRSTEDAIKLANKAFAFLKKWDEQQEKEQGKAKSQIVLMGAGVGSGSGEKKGQTSSNQKGLKISPGAKGSQSPQSPIDQVAQVLLEALDKQGFLKAFIEKVTGQVGNKADPGIKPRGRYRMEGNQVLPPLNPERDQIFVPEGKDRASFNAVKNGLQQEIVTTRNALRVYLQSRNKRGWNRGLDDGELDDDMLWQVSAGSVDRCYKNLRVSTTFNTALVLLLDLSSSMNSNLVKKTAVMMMETGSFLPKVATLVAGFYADPKDQGYPHQGGWPGYGRLTPMYIPLFKGFNESYREARDRVGTISTEGYTPLGEAYAWGLEALMTREEEKRVLWLVTDGEPFFHCGDNNHSDFILMEQTHARCKKWGIRTVGLELGIKALGLANYVDRSVKIPNEGDLPVAVLSLARQLLGRTHV